MMLQENRIEKEKQTIGTIQREIDIITAILLLTGQITIIGVFVTSGGFRISVGGPLTGSSRLEGKSGNQTINTIIDGIDIITAILLLSGEIGVTGTFVSAGRFTINVSGPIFGVPKSEPSLLGLEKDFNIFRRIVSRHYKVDPHLVEKFKKE
jgi:hypothetical protein